MSIGLFQYGVIEIIRLFMLVITAFALIDAAIRPKAAFAAADKQNKTFWLIILGLALLAEYLFPVTQIIPLLGLVAAGKLDPTPIITHRLALGEAAEGYRLFDEREATKVVLRP